MDEHWSKEFEHPSITDENREAFGTSMAKFPTKDDVVVNHIELSKLTGAPFKLPKDLDGMGEEAKADFTSQVNKMFGIIKTKDIKTLADVNLKDGMAEGATYDEDFANSFKQFVVDNSLNVSDMPKYAKFFNEAMAKVAVANATKRENEAIGAATSCEEALIAHPDIGSKENLVKQTELFVRAMKNHVGLTPDEVKELADGLALSKLTTNPVLARVLLKQFAPLATTADIEGGGGGKPPEPAKDPDEGSKTYKALGWSK